MRRVVQVFVVSPHGTMLACGGTTAGEDGGVDGALEGTVKDVFVEGPDPCSTTSYDVDASVCSPQLLYATSCAGQVCGWHVVVPCSGDAGATDAGDAGNASDAATIDCAAWCAATRPPNASGVGCAAYPQVGMVLGALLLAGCAPETVNVAQMIVAPPRPDDCRLELTGGAPTEMSNWDLLGMVTLTRGNTSGLDPSSEDVRSLIRPKACRLGGTSVALMTNAQAHVRGGAQGIVTFMVLRPKQAPAAPTQF